MAEGTWEYDYKQGVLKDLPQSGEKDSILSTDVFSTYRNGTQIGESAMIVIDSKTGEYEKVKIGEWEK